MNYIFNGDNKNKFPILENNSSNEMVKLLKEIYLKNIVYINTIITRDFNKENFVKYSEIVRDVFIVVKRKKKTISSGFLKKMNGINKKKERRLSLLSILKDNDKISLYELELNKFQKTSNFLIEWNPLLNKHMLDSRAEIKKKQDMFDIFKTYNISSKINLKNDIELLKSLGGNPMSKESAIIRFKELKEKSIKNNKYYFRKLYELINKGQNVLFFEEFNKLINDIDINYIYRRTDYTLLMNAVKNENESIIEFLIKKGCDIDIQNHFGNTALHIAFMINNFQVINLLINYNANQNILNNQGLNPWECWKNYYY
jgi:ankyrin repeat protein